VQTIKITSTNTKEHLASLAIREEVFTIGQRIPADIEVDEFEESSTHFLTTIDGIPAGTGRLRIKSPYIKFERIATLNQFRGRGVGRHLMEYMLEYALLNFDKLTPYMHSNIDTVAFYEKLGWMKSGDIFTESNIPLQAMIYKI